MVKEHMNVEKVLGVSMLCSMPGWGDMLAKLPRKASDFVLETLDAVSRLLPCMSDVLVVRCVRETRSGTARMELLYGLLKTIELKVRESVIF